MILLLSSNEWNWCLAQVVEPTAVLLDSELVQLYRRLALGAGDTPYSATPRARAIRLLDGWQWDPMRRYECMVLSDGDTKATRPVTAISIVDTKFRFTSLQGTPVVQAGRAYWELSVGGPLGYDAPCVEVGIASTKLKTFNGAHISSVVSEHCEIATLRDKRYG